MVQAGLTFYKSNKNLVTQCNKFIKSEINALISHHEKEVCTAQFQ